LPDLGFEGTKIPVWRATIGLSSLECETSYQGELDPFPSKASLLSFGPFLQLSKSIKNYLLLLNVEKTPIQRPTELEFYTANSPDILGKVNVNSNALNIISLDELGYKSTDLPVMICRDMAAIPIFFSCSYDGRFLSLEHTHPPASYAVHGERWQAQGFLKSRWFKKVTA